MKNNFDFWQEFNLAQIKKIRLLIDQQKRNNKTCVFADFHMHSIRSSDGKQTLEQILDNTKQKGFQIISITDHDDVRVYDDLFNLIQKKNLDDYPIIITGIEHTVSYPVYGEMCHILKHFINPKDEDLLKDIEIVNNAYLNRAKIQIKRIYECAPLKEIIQNSKIEISFESFMDYLKSKNIFVPDYAPLIDYLADKLVEHNVSFRDLFDRLILDNEQDYCEERRLKKAVRYQKLLQKYENIDVQNNRRFLLSILAVRGVDDEIYFPYKSSGSLSVNEYGQVDIFKLNHNGVTSFAHPTESVVDTLLKCFSIGGRLVAMENNKKNTYSDFSRFENIRKILKAIEIKGSDCHNIDENVYEDMNFYKMDIKVLEDYLNIAEEILK